LIKQPRYVCRVEKPAADREEAMTKVAEIERIRWAHFREGVSVRVNCPSKRGKPTGVRHSQRPSSADRRDVRPVQVPYKGARFLSKPELIERSGYSPRGGPVLRSFDRLPS
jgi:hypothetical protein